MSNWNALAKITKAFFETLEVDLTDRKGPSIRKPCTRPLELAAWRKYRKRRKIRLRILPDFLIGAHAAACADRLLTRDSKFHKTFFASLSVIDPSTLT